MGGSEARGSATSQRGSRRDIRRAPGRVLSRWPKLLRERGSSRGWRWRRADLVETAALEAVLDYAVNDLAIFETKGLVLLAGQKT
jgi:hypothetical protein